MHGPRVVRDEEVELTEYRGQTAKIEIGTDDRVDLAGFFMDPDGQPKLLRTCNDYESQIRPGTAKVSGHADESSPRPSFAGPELGAGEEPNERSRALGHLGSAQQITSVRPYLFSQDDARLPVARSRNPHCFQELLIVGRLVATLEPGPSDRRLQKR
jgi:hypothetical protein